MSLPILHPTARRRPDPQQETRMTRNTRRRVALVLAAACVLATLGVGVAIGAAHRGSHPVPATTASFRFPTASAWPSWVPTVSWPGDDAGAITVAGRKCPRSHPKKIGSGSASSATRVNGGPIRRHSRYRSVCTR